MLLRQGATIWSLVEELNIPHATGMAKKKKKKKKESLQNKEKKQGHYPKSSASQSGILSFSRKAHLANFARVCVTLCPSS